MKNFILISILALTCNLSSAQYKPVDTGSTVQFNIKNFGMGVSGTFTGLKGSISFDIKHPNTANFDVSVDANTVNTGNKMRDNHLRKDSYFNVKDYPRIHFVSTKVTPSAKEGILIVSGKLTIKNQTKDISFPFTATPGKDGYFLKGTFSINRRDFEVGGASIVSDSLEVELNILAKR